jgi:hypothetical protein
MGQWVSNLFERYHAASEYIGAINDAPPTYNTLPSKCGQFVPDPVSPEQSKRAWDRVDKAEKNLAKSKKKPL